MSLKEKIDGAASILGAYPSVETAPELKTVLTKLNRALDDFLTKSVSVVYKNTAEYAELWALMALPENRKTVTLAWLNERGEPVGRRFAKSGKKEKEEFAVMMVRSGRAAAVIRELKESPIQKIQDEFNSMIDLPEEEVALRVKAMKPKDLEQFCNVNNVAIARTAKSGVDKKKTLPHIMRKLEEAREYLKL
ncbi:MAG TPA: hypothetical protein VNO70_19480 [Blastocatellia bacterium]|nr:hypothetical protein [Blastocatellia bacterium]